MPNDSHVSASGPTLDHLNPKTDRDQVRSKPTLMSPPAEFAPAALPDNLGSSTNVAPGGSDRSSSAHPPAAKTLGTFALRYLSTRTPPLRPGDAARRMGTGTRRGMKASASHGSTSPPAITASTRARPTTLPTHPGRRPIPFARAASETTSNTGGLGLPRCQDDTIKEGLAPLAESRSATCSPLAPSPQISIRSADALAEPNSSYRAAESNTNEPSLRIPWAVGGSKREPAAMTTESARKCDPLEATTSPSRTATTSVPRIEADGGSWSRVLETVRLWPSRPTRSGHDAHGGSGSSKRSITVASAPCLAHSSTAAVPAVPLPTTRILGTRPTVP